MICDRNGNEIKEGDELLLFHPDTEKPYGKARVVFNTEFGELMTDVLEPERIKGYGGFVDWVPGNQDWCEII